MSDKHQEDIFNKISSEFQDPTLGSNLWNQPPDSVFDNAFNILDQKRKSKSRSLFFSFAFVFLLGLLLMGLFLTQVKVNSLEDKIDNLANQFHAQKAQKTKAKEALKKIDSQKLTK